MHTPYLDGLCFRLTIFCMFRDAFLSCSGCPSDGQSRAYAPIFHRDCIPITEPAHITADSLLFRSYCKFLLTGALYYTNRIIIYHEQPIAYSSSSSLP